MDLIIVESPTKARTLSRFLEGDFMVEATMGHIKDLPKSVLGVDVKNNFRPEYISVAKKEAIIEVIGKKAKQAKNIFIATDPDREGEAIAAHVADLFGKKKYKRIVFHEITKEAVEEAIKNPRDIDNHLVDAQIARRVLDRLVGYKLSPLLWRKVRRGLSAGRVQSVAVRLLVEREREIEKFKSEEYWEIFSLVKQQKAKDKKAEFIIKLVKINSQTAEINDGTNAKSIIADLEKAAYKVLLVNLKEVSKNPYGPFTTSTMSQAGARLFGWSAKKTMSTAQGLYEKGLITYHRTDSANIAGQAIAKVRDYIKKEYGDKYLPEAPRIYKTKSKVAQEAHEAIRPTNIAKQTVGGRSKYAKDEEMLYGLIWKRFVACQMSQSVYDSTTIDVEASANKQKKNYLLRASGQRMKFDGWRKVYGGVKDEEMVELPKVLEGESLQLIKAWGDQKFTEPPARYNEASLIKTLEQLGVGRPSTYAPIISTIQIRNYVEKLEGKFKPTFIGIAVNDFLMKYFPDVFDYQFTAEMEDSLDNIANGGEKWTAPIKTFWKPFDLKLKSVTKNSARVKIETEKLGKKCPECKKGELVIRIGRFGKFVSCSRFPDCKYTEKYSEKVGVKCPLCKTGDVIVKKTGKGKRFFGCSRYPDCKWASWHSPVGAPRGENMSPRKDFLK